jgi:hypothetical protein
VVPKIAYSLALFSSDLKIVKTFFLSGFQDHEHDCGPGLPDQARPPNALHGAGAA